VGSHRRSGAGTRPAEVPTMRRDLIRALFSLAPVLVLFVSMGAKW
jgi:hypothetical protein